MRLLNFFILVLSSGLVMACAPVHESQMPARGLASVNTDTSKKNQSSIPKAEDAVAAAEKQDYEWPTETDEEVAIHAAAETLDISRPLVRAFINKMVSEHGFEKEYIETTLKKSVNKLSILKAISRPAEKTKEWFEYRPIFLTEKRIDAGRKFIQTNLKSLQTAEQNYGVPKEIITAIIGVETFYGRNAGKYKVLNSLVTLGFNYPPRAKFFRRELELFFLLSREEGFDPTQVLGSYAGAMGNGQFISSSYRNFTADGDGDGKRDLWNSWPDAIHSVANYFKVHNWKAGEEILTSANVELGTSSIFPESKVTIDQHTVSSLRNEYKLAFETSLDDTAPAMFLRMKQKDSVDLLVGFSNFYTITRYNRSPMYARVVHQLSQEFNKPIKTEGSK